MQGSLTAILTYIETARGRGAFLLTIAGGMLAVLGHAPIFFWPAFVVFTALFMLRLDGISKWALPPRRAAFWAGYAFGFGYFLASLYWIASAFLTRGSFYVFLAPFGMLLLPAGLAIFWGLAASAYVKFKPSGPMRALVFAITFFTAEYLRGHILSGFPWNLPGYIWQAGGAVSQSASLLGIYGLTFLTLLLAGSLGAALKIGTARFAPAIASVLIFTALFGFGVARLSGAIIDYVPNTNIRVVQAQMDQLIKYDSEHYFDVINSYLELSQLPSEQALTHVIWPEGAIPGLPLEDIGLMGAIDDVFSGGPDLIMGVTRREDSGKIDGIFPVYNYYNSLMGFKANGTGTPDITAVYNKSKLVPFGEYFPGNQLVEAWNIPGLTRATSSFDFGTPGVTRISGLPITSAQICYEAIFAGFTPRDDAQQPQWILTISNDSWFGASSGPAQHYNQVRYRAIEEGLPIVRSASSGRSGFVDPYGRNLKTLPITQQGIIDNALPKALTPPLYARLRR